jgi:hypothetical protein
VALFNAKSDGLESLPDCGYRAGVEVTSRAGSFWRRQCETYRWGCTGAGEAGGRRDYREGAGIGGKVLPVSVRRRR